GSRVNKTSPNGTLHRPLETEGSRVNKTSLNGTLHCSPDSEGSWVNKTSPTGSPSYPPETQGALVNTPAHTGTPPPSSGGGVTVGNASGGAGAHRDFRQHRDDRWLLVSLLVPICVFLVVMLALGIVYCTRCTCGKGQNVTDCYRWTNHNAKGPRPELDTNTTRYVMG
ncbi:hypothetical protein chiPu_0030844, partial [Chiloscyllium punctatum]|nr:hypothetical protein [Chiloscyllium punctatum]